MANGNIDPSQLSAFGQYLLSGESDLKDEDLLSAVADEVALARIRSQADAAREEAVAAQETTQEQPTTPSFSMNPFGASSQSMPSTFGSDLQNQEAIDQLSNIADIGLKVIGAKDPRSPEAQQEMEMVGGPGPLEAFLPSGLITKTPKVLSGLQKLSKSSTPTSQLPVPRTSQLPDVPGGRPPAVRTSQSPEVVTRPPSTVVRPTGPRQIDAEVSDVTKGGGLIPSLATLGLGSALLTDQAMQDPSQEQVATAPEEVPGVTTAPEGVPGATTAPNLETLAQINTNDLSVPTRPRRNTKDESSPYFVPQMTLYDYKNIARAAGFKGSQVLSAAKQMMLADQQKTLKSSTDIAAAKALIDYRKTGKVTIPESAKTLDAVEEYFSTLNIPFRDEGGNLTTEAREAIASRGRLGEGILGSGIEDIQIIREELDKRDQEAYDYAISNPNDPRSADILNKIKVKVS